jgi:hypothetical protein
MRTGTLVEEFEKWAVLTYTNNRAIINDKKGGDKGIDGTAFFLTDKNEKAKIVFQVKIRHCRAWRRVQQRPNARRAELGIFLTLQSATQGMKKEASEAGRYDHKLMGRSYDRISILTIKEIVEATVPSWW